MTAQSPVFKSARGQAQFFAAYDAAMALWRVSFERRDVRTLFGRTHVIISGAESAPPLVLLHCALMTSAIWSPVIGDLSANFRTYAVDVIGDVGRTVPSNPPRTYEDLGRWLSETLDALGVMKASVLGGRSADLSRPTSRYMLQYASRGSYCLLCLRHSSAPVSDSWLVFYRW